MYTWKIKGTGKKFKTPVKWEEITVAKFAEYESLIRDIKKDFVTVFELKDESEIKNVTTAEILIKYPIYFVKILVFWTGLSEEMVLKINKNDVFAIYEYMNKLIAQNTVERKIDKFTFKGVTYLFPQSKEEINGKTALMGGETFGAMITAFQQSANLDNLKQGRFDVVANQMAILCRPKGEEYNSDNDAKRAKLFQGLSMDIVWQFTFFLIRQTIKYKLLTRTSISEEKEIIS